MYTSKCGVGWSPTVSDWVTESNRSHGRALRGGALVDARSWFGEQIADQPEWVADVRAFPTLGWQIGRSRVLEWVTVSRISPRELASRRGIALRWTSAAANGRHRPIRDSHFSAGERRPARPHGVRGSSPMTPQVSSTARPQASLHAGGFAARAAGLAIVIDGWKATLRSTGAGPSRQLRRIFSYRTFLEVFDLAAKLHPMMFRPLEYRYYWGREVRVGQRTDSYADH
jgi:hypothetical protein